MLEFQLTFLYLPGAAGSVPLSEVIKFLPHWPGEGAAEAIARAVLAGDKSALPALIDACKEQYGLA